MIEEELKTTLKTLFSEKKKVKDLEKRVQELEEENQQLKKELNTQHIDQENLREKFFEKLRHQHDDQVVQEKEEEIATLKKQLSVVKPTLKKIVEDLKKSREQLETITLEKQILMNKVLEIESHLQLAKSHNDEKAITISELKDQIFQLKEEHLLVMQKNASLALANEVPLDFKLLSEQLAEKQKECASKEEEILKAQQHLAKKVKENTLLRDLLEKQKTYLNEYHQQSAHLQTTFANQKQQEEKNTERFKTQLKEAEAKAHEWQEKCSIMHAHWENINREYVELQKVKQDYEQLIVIFNNLKAIVHNTFDHPLLNADQRKKRKESMKELNFED